MKSIACFHTPKSFLVISFTSFYLAMITPSYAQINKLKDKLKEKADQLMEADPKSFLDKSPEELLKEQALKKTEENQAGFDTTSFIYTIAFLDKTESFENQQKNEKFYKAANFLLKDETNTTEKDAAKTYYELGRYNYLKRNYKLAELNLKLAREAYLLLGMESDPIFLKTLATLALLYNDMGRYDQALTIADEVSDGWKNSSGTGSKGYLSAMHNRAVILMNQGQFATAEKAFLSIQSQINRSEGTSSMPAAILQNNLAILYLKLGRMQDAGNMIEETIRIADLALGEKEGTYIQLLTNQALIYQQNKAYDKAESTYLRAKDLQESRLKLNRTSDPDFAHLLSNMAALYMYKGDLTQAENYLAESLKIQKNKYGEQFPAVAAVQYELGNLYRFKKDWQSAKDIYSLAYDSRVKLLGEQHPTTIQSLYGLAIAEWFAGDQAVAKKHLEIVLDASLGFVDDFFASMSEVEKTSYWDQVQPYFLSYFNFAAMADDPNGFLEPLFRYRTATKGILLSSTTRLKNIIQSSGDTELIRLYNQWVDQKKSLAVYYSLSRDELIQQGINLDSLEQDANRSERLLSEKSGLFDNAIAKQKGVTIADVRQQLAPQQRLVEIIQYPILDGFLTDQNGYMAILIAPDGLTKLVVLDAELMDTKSYSAYKNLIRLKVADQRSYNAYWQPIDEHLHGASEIILSSDGIYHQINLATLWTPDNRYLIDRYTIHLIDNPKNLVETHRNSQPVRNAFLLGYPDYGTDQIAPLPGTNEEVTAISNVLRQAGVQFDIRKQQQASETAIKTQKNPSIFHVATHGFFLKDVAGESGDVFGIRVDQATKNPLLRAGLLLAGVQSGQAETHGSFEENDNGILNAFEAINLDLSNTQLVVLSACETGTGDIKSGEGVYGLQRAFKIAGADQLLMSLWKVDDNATKELMINFYTNWINKKMEPAEAFRSAQLAVKTTYPQPYYWGAFVMVE